MPDLTEHAATVCETNFYWEELVVGSGGAKHVVTWSGLSPREAELQSSQYGYSCTCRSYQFAKTGCRHIEKVKGGRCAWNWEMDPASLPYTGPGDPRSPHVGGGDPRCPQCAGPCKAVRVAV